VPPQNLDGAILNSVKKLLSRRVWNAGCHRVIHIVVPKGHQRRPRNDIDENNAIATQRPWFR
jgi:hypothetical protein